MYIAVVHASPSAIMPIRLATLYPVRHLTLILTLNLTLADIKCDPRLELAILFFFQHFRKVCREYRSVAKFEEDVTASITSRPRNPPTLPPLPMEGVHG